MLRARFMVRRGALKFHRIDLSWEEIAALVKVCVCLSICTDGRNSRRVSDDRRRTSADRGGSSTTIGPSVRTMVGSVIRPVPAETTRNPRTGCTSA
jgi:hypothetical protein